MAYGPKFRLESEAPDGHTYRADIEQQGYSGSVTTMTAHPDGIQLGWDIRNRQDLSEPLMICRGSLRAREEDPSPLAEIFDGDRFEYRVKIYKDGELYFVGFVNTDLYEDSLWKYLSDPKIEFTDALGHLSDLAFAEAGSEEDVREALMRALEMIPSDLQAEINMQWFPGGMSGEAIEQVYVPDEAWNEGDSDTAPNPTPKRDNARSVLRSLLRRFGMRLMQSAGKWRLRQRMSLLDDSLDVATYNADGTRASTSTETGRERDLTNYSTEDEGRSFQNEFGAASVKYSFAKDLGQVLPNPSFEDSLTEWATSGNAQRVDVDTVSDMSTTSGDKKAVKLSGSNDVLELTEAISLPSDTGVSLELSWRDVRGGSTFPVKAKWSVSSESGHNLQRRTSPVLEPALAGQDTTLKVEEVGAVTNGIDGLPIIPAGAELPLHTNDPSVSPDGNAITLTEPLRVGDTSLKGRLAQEIKSTDDQDLYPVVEYWQWVASSHSEFTQTSSESHYFQEHTLSAFMVTGTGDPVSGDIGLKWFTGENEGQGFYAIDDVSLTLERDGEEIRSFMTTTSHESGDREEITVPVGIGPHERSDSRIYTASDETPSDWKRGEYSGGSLSGRTLSELHTRENLRMQRTSPETRSFDITLRQGDADILPHFIYTDGGTRYEVLALQRNLLQGRARLDLVEIQDEGTSGFTTTTQYQEDEAATRGGGSSVQVVQGDGGGGASTWTELTDKPGNLLARDGDSDGYPETSSIQSDDLKGLSPNLDSLTFGTNAVNAIRTDVRASENALDTEIVTEAGIRTALDTVQDDVNSQSLSDLTDVNLDDSSKYETHDILAGDGSGKYVDKTIGTVLAEAVLKNVGNVGASDPAEGESLIWNEANLEWIAQSVSEQIREDGDLSVGDVAIAGSNHVIKQASQPSTGGYDDGAIWIDTDASEPTAYVLRDGTWNATSSAIAGSNLVNESIQTRHITADAVETDQLSADAITAGKIAADAAENTRKIARQALERMQETDEAPSHGNRNTMCGHTSPRKALQHC